MKTFQAYWVEELEDGSFKQSIIKRKISDLPDNEVLIQVHYAGLNYKDALSSTGNKGITRQYPHTPGVDASGIIVTDKTGKFNKGEKVIVTSYDLGMNTSGGFAEYICVPASWVVPLPKGLSLREAMVLGTGAYTAGLALYKMEMCGQQPEMGKILVTGATGGVGSHAVEILTKAGYEVIAVTGKPKAAVYLKSLGATEIISRDDANDKSKRALMRPKWAGAIDTVGGDILATALKACNRNGNVAACGLVISPKLETTVFPFILNGVNLLGIDSAETPMSIRLEVWKRLANRWKSTQLEQICNPIELENLQKSINLMLKGEHVGRTVVSFA
jgi:putative YhdH/YhfP family quinone oxidoreductase